MSVPGSGSEPGSSGPPTPHPADGTPPDLQDDPSFQADLLAHVTDAVIAIDGQNRIVYWNQAAERTYGWAADEVLGGDARTLLHPDLTIEEPESRARAIRETGRWQGRSSITARMGASWTWRPTPSCTASWTGRR